MNKIYRTISLEDFKSRFTNENNDAFGTEWGKVVPRDYLVTGKLLDIVENIPLVDGNRLRFGTMIKLNTWLNDVIDASAFFKLCQRNGEYKWIAFDYAKITEEDNFNGIYPEIPFSYEDFEIGDFIWVTSEAENLLNIFLADSGESQSLVVERIGEFFDIVEAAKNNTQETAGTAYAVFNITLTENCNEVGKFTKGVVFWEPNKKYCGGEYAFSPIDGRVYHLNKGTGYTESTETFNESGYWEAEESEEAQTPITFKGESQLDALKRVKHSYDDYGNELPFIYNGTATGETLYATGVIYNTSIDGDKMYGDVITNITTAITSITFTYVIGAEIDSDRNPVSGTGIIYQEGYKKNDESFTFKQNGINVTVEYANIHFDEELPDYLPADAQKEKRYANITFNPIIYHIDSDVPFIMEESMVGITDIKKSGVASVERGTAAAFEIHNILGECRTMEDLEKYRNDFFTIKDDEKQ